MTYEAFYRTPWTPSAQQEEEHRRLTKSIRSWARPKKLTAMMATATATEDDQDFDEVLVLLVLLSTLYGNASQGSVQQERRNRLLKLLNRYLQHSYGRDRAWELIRFSLSIEEKAKRIYDVHSQMLIV